MRHGSAESLGVVLCSATTANLSGRVHSCMYRRSYGYHWTVATAVKKLDLAVGEFVEIAGRRYEVVPDREGGVTIEPPITPASDLHAERGTSPASTEDFERLTAGDPSDGEG